MTSALICRVASANIRRTYLRYHAVLCVIWHQFPSIWELAEDILQRFSL